MSAAGSTRWRLTAPSKESDMAESRAGAVRQEGEEMKGRGGVGKERAAEEKRRSSPSSSSFSSSH